ncbi:MAG: hypothetical protein MJ090_00295 [Clostridia bacterium]|nr:hypothetical protein [Clostridia bacterium]
MLKKLYKHEFIALYRALLPLYGVLFGLSVVTRVLSFFADNSNDIISFCIDTLTVLSSITITGIFIVGFVYIIVRFYQNLLSKQGYLTNTLPIKTYKHIICKLVCGIVVQISGVVLMIISLIIMFGTKAGIIKLWNFLLSGYNSFSKAIGNANTIAMLIELFILIIISLATNLLMYYACMAIGQQFKNRILASIIAYFCIKTATQIILIVLITVCSFVSADFAKIILANSTVTTLTQGFMLFCIALVLIEGAVYYFITNHFLSKKLNLE